LCFMLEKKTRVSVLTEVVSRGVPSSSKAYSSGRGKASLCGPAPQSTDTIQIPIIQITRPSMVYFHSLRASLTRAPRDAAAQQRLDERGRGHPPRPRQGPRSCLRPVWGGVRGRARPAPGRCKLPRPPPTADGRAARRSHRSRAPACGAFRVSASPCVRGGRGLRDGPSSPRSSPPHRRSPSAPRGTRLSQALAPVAYATT
jgi:hypothetical protein